MCGGVECICWVCVLTVVHGCWVSVCGCAWLLGVLICFESAYVMCLLGVSVGYVCVWVFVGIGWLFWPVSVSVSGLGSS
jgi:hypothetical protein